MSPSLTSPKKHLIEYLPAIYRDTDPPEAGQFLAKFLLAYERLLLDGDWKEDDARLREAGNEIPYGPFERTIEDFHFHFNALESPEEFLSWLAGWVALDFRPELSEARRRRLLVNIVPLYRIRGTRKYVEEILRICVDATPMVSDTAIPAMQVGDYSTVGEDTSLGGDPPHFFRVWLAAPGLEEPDMAKQVRLAANLIEISKPAHTYYSLEIITSRMRVGITSDVGQNTIVG
jgi:phage tail-like protein